MRGPAQAMCQLFMIILQSQSEVALLQSEVVELALHGLCVNSTHSAAGRGGTSQSAMAEHAALQGLCVISTHIAAG